MERDAQQLANGQSERGKATLELKQVLKQLKQLLKSRTKAWDGYIKQVEKEQASKLLSYITNQSLNSVTTSQVLVEQLQTQFPKDYKIN